MLYNFKNQKESLNNRIAIRSCSVSWYSFHYALRKKWSFPLRISSVKSLVARIFLQIWSYLLKKSLIENFIFCAGMLITNQKSLGFKIFLYIHVWIINF